LVSFNADYKKVGDEFYSYMKQRLQVENDNRDEFKKHTADISAFLNKQSTTLTENVE
jgi:hypothetical protein